MIGTLGLAGGSAFAATTNDVSGLTINMSVPKASLAQGQSETVTGTLTYNGQPVDSSNPHFCNISSNSNPGINVTVIPINGTSSQAISPVVNGGYGEVWIPLNISNGTFIFTVNSPNLTQTGGQFSLAVADAHYEVEPSSPCNTANMNSSIPTGQEPTVVGDVTLLPSTTTPTPTSTPPASPTPSPQPTKTPTPTSTPPSQPPVVSKTPTPQPTKTPTPSPKPVVVRTKPYKFAIAVQKSELTLAKNGGTKDPGTIVFKSANGLPIANAQVSLRIANPNPQIAQYSTWVTLSSNTVTTNSQGQASFTLIGNHPAKVDVVGTVIKDSKYHGTATVDFKPLAQHKTPVPVVHKPKVTHHKAKAPVHFIWLLLVALIILLGLAIWWLNRRRRNRKNDESENQDQE